MIDDTDTETDTETDVDVDWFSRFLLLPLCGSLQTHKVYLSLLASSKCFVDSWQCRGSLAFIPVLDGLCFASQPCHLLGCSLRLWFHSQKVQTATV